MMTVQKLAQNPIFIVGCPRSGTTLLQALIANQGAFSAFPETHFFSSALHLGLLEQNFYSRNEVNKILDQIETAGHLGINQEILSQLDNHSTDGQIGQKDLFELIIRSLSPSPIQPDTRWMEKTPTNNLCLERIATLYPDAKYVGIVRDPFNTIHSILNKLPPNGTNKCEKTADLWALHQRKMFSFFKKHPEKISIIKYESLAENPENVLKDVCLFLNIDFSTKRMNITNNLKNTIVRDFETWKSNITKDISNNNVPGYKLFKMSDLFIIQKRIYPHCEYLGYRTYYKQIQFLYNFFDFIKTRSSKILRQTFANRS